MSRAAVHATDKGAADKKAATEKAAEQPSALPAGALVEAHSLATAAFNGPRGRVEGMRGDRVVVRFPEPRGEKALKAVNRRLVGEEAATRRGQGHRGPAQGTRPPMEQLDSVHP